MQKDTVKFHQKIPEGIRIFLNWKQQKPFLLNRKPLKKRKEKKFGLRQGA